MSFFFIKDHHFDMQQFKLVSGIRNNHIPDTSKLVTERLGGLNEKKSFVISQTAYQFKFLLHKIKKVCVSTID